MKNNMKIKYSLSAVMSFDEKKINKILSLRLLFAKPFLKIAQIIVGRPVSIDFKVKKVKKVTHD